jgi:broad specificity phosphatase PhoE
VSRTQGRIIVIRHGETEWSRDGRHTGRTDVPLTPTGERDARALSPRMASLTPGLVLTSPLQRARLTAELAGLSASVDDRLVEWDYGDFEGRTTTEIRDALHDPAWSVWNAVGGLGESVDDVGDRARGVLERCRPYVDRGDDVVLVAHSHLLRILTAVWLGLPPSYGASFVLDPAGVGELGDERTTPVLLSWNS